MRLYYQRLSATGALAHQATLVKVVEVVALDDVLVVMVLLVD